MMVMIRNSMLHYQLYQLFSLDTLYSSLGNVQRNKCKICGSYDCSTIFDILVGCDGDGLWYRVEMEAGS